MTLTGTRMITGTSEPASAGWRALGTSVVLKLTEVLVSSSTTTRHWIHDLHARHHIVDPRTGAPVESMWRTVSVAAATCVDTNIARITALVGGNSCVARLAESGLPARLVAQDGRVRRVAGWPAESDRPEVSTR